ncbi:MAG: shikimate dehydrogenase [Chlamydiia bacterium]|nr:shikimate dehydrogenase [Chlamydiia bacterium]
MLVISIQGSFEEAKQTIQQAHHVGELIELRIDLLEKNDLSHISKLKSFAKLPVIFTLRRKDQGGAFEGNERERKEKILELLSLKPDYVDLEYDCTFADKVNVPLIASYHDFEKTPENLDAVLAEMNRFPAAIKKIATFAHSSLDALRILQLVQTHKIAGMCMGEKGKITRILGPVVDTPLVYASLGKETAPGQVSAKELIGLYHFNHLNRQTKIYGLIGDPVDKSIGHLCHNHVFQKEKENAVYVKIPLTPSEVAGFFHEIASLPFYGLSVTMPLKEKVAPFLDGVDKEAKKMGAINTLTKREGKWFGTNTDGDGALDALETKGTVQGKILLIIGAGGAAKAIAHAAKDRGGKIIIANRTAKKGEILATQVEGMATSLEELPDYDILINTTPIGMAPAIQYLPIPEESIRDKKVIFDVISNPKETKLLNIGLNKGGQIVYGYEMFSRQALRQLKSWLDRPLEEEKILSLIESFAFL